MLEVDENFECLPDDAVRLAPGDVDHKADAARIVLELGIVQALFGWQR